MIFSTSSLLEKLVPCRNSLRKLNKLKSEWAHIWTVKRMWQLFPTKLIDGYHLLLQYWSFALSWWNPTTDLRKDKVLFSVPTEFCSSQMFSIVTFQSAKMNVVIESTISGVFAIVGLPSLSSSWILFQNSLNNLAHVKTFST